VAPTHERREENLANELRNSPSDPRVFHTKRKPGASGQVEASHNGGGISPRGAIGQKRFPRSPKGKRRKGKDSKALRRISGSKGVKGEDG